jgi:dihydroxy-acid dehydratase
VASETRGRWHPVRVPVHPIEETRKRPTAALDRNLQYLSLVEILYGYPIDVLC